jgi:acyl carrier protein
MSVEFLAEQLVEIFEVDQVQPLDTLRDFELWDSLSVISLIAVLDEHFGINIEATELAEVITVADLYSFVEQRRTK